MAVTGERRAATGRCDLVAAIDDNHDGDVERARRLIEIAREAGADSVKLRIRTPGATFVRRALERRMSEFPQLGRTVREVLQGLALPAADLRALVDGARAAVTVVIAPADLPAVDTAMQAGPAMLQLDAPNIVHDPLIAALRNTGMPVRIAVGGCSPSEVQGVVSALGAQVHGLLAPLRLKPSETFAAHVRYWRWLAGLGVPCGYVADRAEADAAAAAVAFGATVVQARLTLSRASEGPGHQTSMDPGEFRAVHDAVRDMETALAAGAPTHREDLPDDTGSERPSLVAACAIPCGTVITREMLAVKAPMGGLSPRLLPYVEGRRAMYDLEPDDFITFGVIST